MIWLPLFLILCGFTPSQASQIATALDIIDQTGSVCPGTGD
ncbi:hypothetical protein [Sphingomonas pituitosa]|nr:hypothetical protein [Sphingomonas pituitosa]